MAGRFAASQGLAITYKMYVQQPTKTFCNFMQKGLAKNNLLEWKDEDYHKIKGLGLQKRAKIQRKLEEYGLVKDNVTQN